MPQQQTIAIFNQSGGVGKTTLTFNLGYHLSKLGLKVLLVDLDPQASLTLFCGLEPEDLEVTIYHPIMDTEQPLPIHSLGWADLVPANINLAGAELELATDGMRDIRLKDALETAPSYDLILIDCPPSLGVLSTIALVASNSVLIPIQTEYKSLMGASLLLQTIARLRKRSNRGLKIAGFVPTMFSANVTQHERGLAGIREQLGPIAPVFPPLPRRIDFANSGEEHKPLALYRPGNPALPVLDEIASKIGGVA